MLLLYIHSCALSAHPRARVSISAVEVHRATTHLWMAATPLPSHPEAAGTWDYLLEHYRSRRFTRNMTGEEIES
jgi:hypothetical protein